MPGSYYETRCRQTMWNGGVSGKSEAVNGPMTRSSGEWRALRDYQLPHHHRNLQAIVTQNHETERVSAPAGTYSAWEVPEDSMDNVLTLAWKIVPRLCLHPPCSLRYSRPSSDMIRRLICSGNAVSAASSPVFQGRMNKRRSHSCKLYCRSRAGLMAGNPSL